jgi:hypothetical protein
MVGSKASAESLNVVVGTLDQGFTGNIVDTRLLGRAKREGVGKPVIGIAEKRT